MPSIRKVITQGKATFEGLPFTTRLAVVLNLAVLLVFCVMGVLVSQWLNQRLQERNLNELTHVNRQVVDMVDAYASLLERSAERLGNAFVSTLPEAPVLSGKRVADGERVLPVLLGNGRALNNDFQLVDRFTRSTGATASVFVRDGDDFFRITTSVKQENGRRAVGTPLGHSHPAYGNLMKGLPYTGRATLFGREFMTRYQPLKDEAGQVIGLAYIGIDFTENLMGLKDKIRAIDIADKGYVFILDREREPGRVILHPTLPEMNVLDLQDDKGSPFVAQMIREGQGHLRYLWANRSAGEREARERTAIYSSFARWGWLVATVAYTDEVMRDVHTLNRQLLAFGALIAASLMLVIFFTTRVFRRAADALEAEQARLRSVLENGADAVFIANPDGRCRYANQQAGKLLGVPPAVLQSRGFADLTAPGDENTRRILENLGPGGPVRSELMLQRQDGSQVPVEMNAALLPDGDIFASCRDITEKKRIAGELDRYREHLEEMLESRTRDLMAANASLTQARDVAESANRAKSAFLANMSHEIRTPINAVLGFSQLCLKTDLSARQNDYVLKIESAAESLLGIVNNILDFSKIEAGKLEMECIPFSLDEVLAQVSNLFSHRARAKSLEFAFGALPGVPGRLVGDPLRLGQVLTNLVGNALKFTDRGEIAVTVEALEGEAGKAFLRFSVRDTGLGLSPAQQERLFSAFSQADNSTTRKFGGTGLGLAICKQLVEQMGGDIGVDSAPGQGSCFSFTARFGIDGEQQALPPLLSGKRLLVVDDNGVMRTLLTRLVAALGCAAESVDSGEAALDRLTAAPGFDAVIMDWRLPGRDGLETARQIRQQGLAMPIILITGDEVTEARSQVGLDVVQACLGKPVSRAALRDTLVQVLGGQIRVPLTARAVAATPNLSGRHILLVDDNEFNRQVGRELIELSGAKVDTAENGLEAVQMGIGGKYDLVLMDIQMPVMDGYTAAHALRLRFPDLPILALTAHALADERPRVLAIGMNDILTKPIRPAVLDAALVHWLGGESHTAPVHAPRLVGAADPVSVLTESVPETQVAAAAATAVASAVAPEPEARAAGILDVDAGLVTAKGNRAFYGRLLQMFLKNPSTDMEALQAALARNDRVVGCRQAHTLKSLAASIGAHHLRDAAHALELALAGTAGAGEAALLATLEERLAAARGAVEEELAG